MELFRNFRISLILLVASLACLKCQEETETTTISTTTTTTTTPAPKSEAICPPSKAPTKPTGACKWQGFDTEDKPCPNGTVELMRDTNGTASNRACCNPKHSDWPKKYEQTPFTCRTTSCTNQTSDPCSTLSPRFVNDTQLEYEEILRDACYIDTDENEGVSALCCVRNSTQSLLASALGAELNEFPHQAKLLLPGHCGGTVYNSWYIITAAHCVVTASGDFSNPRDMKVILGSNNGASDIPDEYVYGVNQVIVHPEYSRLKYHPNIENGNRIFNDIALLELNSEIEFSDEVKALEIAPKDFDPMQYADKSVLVGWGTTDTLEVSAHLQKANFLLRTDQACFVDGFWDAYEDFKEQVLCVGGILEGKWSPVAAPGDSGGPAICRGQDGTPLLCGISSFGGNSSACSAKNDEENCPPSVYSEVSYFHDWIKIHAGEQDESSLYKPFIYGEGVKAEMAAHQVEITSSEGEYPCGGTLVGKNIIVTTAHCVVKSDNSSGKWEVLNGLIVTSGNSSLGIEGVEVLPGFYEDTDDKFQATEKNKNSSRPIVTDSFYVNNLAVLKINSSINLSPPKSWYPLAPRGGKIFNYGVEFAFPRNSTYFEGSTLSRREFKILGKDDCQTRISRMSRVGSNITVDSNLLCGVEKYSGGSVCDRSLGGGLICKGEGGADILCGVQVFRFCEFSFPNAFLNVGMYAEWVRDAIKKLEMK